MTVIINAVPFFLGVLLVQVPSVLIRIGTSPFKKYPAAAVAIFCFTAGTFAFWYKKKWLLGYGFTEIAFGVASAYQVSAGANFTGTVLAKWTALGGSIYVVSRGWNNVSDHRRTRRLANTTIQSTEVIEPKILKAKSSEFQTVEERNAKLLERQRLRRRGPTLEFSKD